MSRRGHGDLAQAILDVLDRAVDPMTPAQVRDTLGGQLAYTTVMTVLTRLHDQGLLGRARTGRAYAYRPLRDPAQVTARRMHRLLAVDADHEGVLARFVDELSRDDERVLRGLLDRLATAREPTAREPTARGRTARDPAAPHRTGPDPAGP